MAAAALLASALLLVLLSVDSVSSSIPPSQIRSLIRLPKLLEYPAAVSPLQWSPNTTAINFCGIPPRADFNLTCNPSGTTVVALQVMGASSAKLSSNFSMESLGNLLFSLPDLQTLALVHLGLWGSIPGKLDRLQQLKSLKLSSNFLNGALPERLSTLSQLQILDVSSNEIGGAFPAWLADLHNLTDIDVSSNLLTGQPPQSFLGSSSSRVRVKFDNNCLATTVQPQYGKEHCSQQPAAATSPSSLHSKVNSGQLRACHSVKLLAGALLLAAAML